MKVADHHRFMLNRVYEVTVDASGTRGHFTVSVPDGSEMRQVSCGNTGFSPAKKLQAALEEIHCDGFEAINVIHLGLVRDQLEFLVFAKPLDADKEYTRIMEREQRSASRGGRP